MLARSQAIHGVETIAVDRSGVLLRVTATPEALALVIDMLRDGGHEAALLDADERDDALARVANWYAAEAAAELSAEEAEVLAGRIVAAFSPDGSTVPAAVGELVRDELSATFAAARGGAPHASALDRCAGAVERRATPLLGAPEAARLRAQVRQALNPGDGTEGVA